MTQVRRRGTARAAVRLVLVATIVVAVVLGVVFVGQRSLIYFPDPDSPGAAAAAIDGARDVTLHTSDQLELDAWLVPADERVDRERAVLYLPGNGGNRAGRVDIAAELSQRGFTVLLVDYRGYGGNPGRASEAGLARDARAAQELLEAEGFPGEQQLYLGESLGTAVATELATERPPGALLLRSPFTELADVGRTHYPWLPVGLLLRDRYPLLEHMQELDVPVTVVRGGADSVVPTELSRQVAAATPHLVEEVILEGADHNDPAMWGAPVADAMTRLADEVDGRA